MHVLRRGLFFVPVVSSLAMGYPLSRNPDQRPSFGFQAGGSIDVNSDQVVSSARASLGRDAASHSLNFAMDVLVPFADAWSLQVAGGLSSQQAMTDEAIVLPATSVDSPFANGLISLRGYFLDHSLVPEPPQQNPDRWPSVGLSAIGSATLYRDEIDTFRGTPIVHPVGNIQTLSCVVDTRIPLANSLTLLMSLSGNFGASSVDETASAAGSELRAQTLTYGGGVKYYFVGQNLIGTDRQINPDRWISLAVTASGQTTVGGFFKITRGGTEDQRDIDINGFSVNAELRLPLTDYLTFRLGLGGGILHQEVLASTSNLGAKNSTPSINGVAGIRHYFR